MLHVTSGSNCFLVDAKGSELNFSARVRNYPFPTSNRVHAKLLDLFTTVMQEFHHMSADSRTISPAEVLLK